MKNTVTKAKRRPRPPGTMAKAWETRRRNQANAKMLREGIADANQTKNELSHAMLEAAKGMSETLYGDPQPGSFIERYKIVSRYKEYLENLGFTVTYDPF